MNGTCSFDSIEAVRPPPCQKSNIGVKNSTIYARKKEEMSISHFGAKKFVESRVNESDEILCFG